MLARFLLVLLMATAACHSAAGPSASGPVGRAAPDFTAKALDGREVSLASYRGKVIVLDIWACWCKSCLNELPLLDDLAARRKPEGVEVLAVSIDEERHPIDRILATRSSWSMTVLQDPSGKVAEKYEASSLPVVFVIDRDGVIRYQAGVVDAEHANQIDLEIDKLVQVSQMAQP